MPIKMEDFNAKKLAIMTPESLMKVINKHTLRIIEYERDFWEDEGNPRAIDEYLDYLEMLEDKAKECKPTEANYKSWCQCRVELYDRNVGKRRCLGQRMEKSYWMMILGKL